MNQNGTSRWGMKLAELVICMVAVILGLIYLNTDWIPLSVLLPVYAVFFTAVPVLRLIDMKRNGGKGIALLFPAICYLLLSVVVIAAAVVYFVIY